MISGIPAAVEYASYLLTRLPSILEYSMNDVLEEHVHDARERLDRDGDYRQLARYYDVVENEDEEGELVFGLFDVPERLKDRAQRLEYGDDKTPPRAFVRRTLFKEGEEIAKKVGKGARRAMGEVVVGAD